MITGSDSVILTAVPPAPAIRRFLDRWLEVWPDMRADLHGDGFAPWSQLRELELPETGEVLVAKNQAMQDAWDEHGYELPGVDEGPFTLMYQPCSATRFTVTVTSDPYAPDSGFGFAPYPAQVLGAGLHLVTAVTPSTMKDFSDRVVGDLTAEFAPPSSDPVDGR
jgi:hypothetical protein